jgi:RNA polymerase sigma-70 factor, ECF subfamily
MATDPEQLLAAIRDNDPAALEELWTTYRRRLQYLARRRGLAWEDAEDLAHNVLLAAQIQIQDGRFEGRGKLGAWVYSILNNQIKNFWRGVGKDRERLVTMDSFEQLETDLARSDADVTSAEVRASLREALSRLPARQRVVLLLNVYGHLRAREIAPLLGLGKKVAEAALTSAKKNLRKLLGGAEEERALERRTEREML